MLQNIATIWAIAGAVVWLALHNAGFIEHACVNLRYPNATMAMLTLGIIVGWPIILAMYLWGWLCRWGTWYEDIGR